jgi:NitT/TauT family transport system permease protein
MTTAAVAEAGGKLERRGSFTTVGLPLISLALVLAVWDVVTRLEVVPDFLLPSPWAIFATLGTFVAEILTGGEALGHFLTTLSEIVIGFLISVVLGVVLAALMSESKWISDAVYPYVVAFDSTPKVAVAPLFVIWFGFGQMSKIVMVITIATFPVVINTLAGLKATDPASQKLMRSLGASRWETFIKLRARNALPLFFAGLELAITGAAIGAVVGEFRGNKGLGYLTLRAQEMFQLPEAFATIVLLGIQGVILHRLIILMRRRVVFWTQERPT